MVKNRDVRLAYKSISWFSVLLTHFSPVSHFYAPWKRQKTKGFLTFSGGIEMWHWTTLSSSLFFCIQLFLAFFIVQAFWSPHFLGSRFFRDQVLEVAIFLPSFNNTQIVNYFFYFSTAGFFEIQYWIDFFLSSLYW